MVAYLDLADYLLIAEAVLGVPAETIAHWPGIGLAESALQAPQMGFGEVEFYPELIDKAAVLCGPSCPKSPASLRQQARRPPRTRRVPRTQADRLGTTRGRQDGLDDRRCSRRRHLRT